MPMVTRTDGHTSIEHSVKDNDGARRMTRESGLHLGCTPAVWKHEDRSFAYALKAMRDIGFTHTEVVGMYGHHFVVDMGFLPFVSLFDDPRCVRALVEQHDLAVSQVVACGFLMGDAALDHGVAYVRRGIEYAAAVGAPYVDTIDGTVKPEGMTDDEIYTQMGVLLNAMLETAERYGVGINLEPHGPFTTTIEGMERLLDLAKPRYRHLLGVNFDMGNTFIAGTDPVAFLDAFRDRIRHIHVKDVTQTLVTSGLGTSTGIATSAAAVGDGANATNIGLCIERLQGWGWSGVLAVETDGDDRARRSFSWLQRHVGHSNVSVPEPALAR
jgi:inosose dehydratase